VRLNIQEGLHLIQFEHDIGCAYQFGPLVIYGDNQGAIALSRNPVDHQRSKHIDIRYRDEVNSGRIAVQYCPMANMVAYMMMKPATKVKLCSFKDFIFWSVNLC